jgi:DDE superfamily endonuclease
MKRFTRPGTRSGFYPRSAAFPHTSGHAAICCAPGSTAARWLSDSPSGTRLLGLPRPPDPRHRRSAQTPNHAYRQPQHLGPPNKLTMPACHVTEQYANNAVEADHGRLKARLRPMRGLKHLRSARVICAGHTFVQNIRRGHYELRAEEVVNLRVAAAFDELTPAI